MKIETTQKMANARELNKKLRGNYLLKDTLRTSRALAWWMLAGQLSRLLWEKSSVVSSSRSNREYGIPSFFSLL